MFSHTPYLVFSSLIVLPSFYVHVAPPLTQPPTPPQVYDRQGNQVSEFVKGYPYIMELKQTKGHKSGCTGGCWHPTEDNVVLTCATDGSLRQWDVNRASEQNLDVIKIGKTTQGKRLLVTACAYNATGTLMAGAGVDGSIQVRRALQRQ